MPAVRSYRNAVALVRTDTEIDRNRCRHDCRASATENILPMFSFFVVAVPSTSRALYTCSRWHGNTNFRYKVIFRKFNFRHLEHLRKLELYENYRLYGILWARTYRRPRVSMYAFHQKHSCLLSYPHTAHSHLSLERFCNYSKFNVNRRRTVPNRSVLLGSVRQRFRPIQNSYLLQRKQKRSLEPVIASICVLQPTRKVSCYMLFGCNKKV